MAEQISRRELVKRGVAGAAVLGMGGVVSPGASARPAAGARRAAKRTSLLVLEASAAPSADWDGTGNSNPFTHELIVNTYRQLIKFARRDLGDVVVPVFGRYTGDLAESWQQHGLDWTFKIRKGIRSAAGNELTADDVIWTFARAKARPGPVPGGWFLSNAGSILKTDVFNKGVTSELRGEVVKVDQYTVRFRQFEPNEVFPAVLSPILLSIVDSKLAKSHATAADPWAFKWMDTQGTAGFGAYSLEAWNKGVSYTLRANPNYAPAPQFTTVHVQGVPASANRIAALLQGQADVITDLSPEEFQKVRESRKAKVLELGSSGTFLSLGLNYKIALWDGGGDARRARLLRQAVAYAMPYEQIVEHAYFGAAHKWNGFVSTGYYGNRPFPGRYTTNVAKATQLLAAAGYPNGKGLPDDGLELVYPAERQTIFQPIANFVRTALARIGIEIKLNPIAQSQFSTRYGTTRDMPMWLDQNSAIVADAGYMVQVFWVPKAAGGLLDTANWESAEMVKVWKAQKGATGKRRLGLLAQMQRLMMEELPGIPIAEVSALVGVRRDLTDWSPRLEFNRMTMATWKTK